MPVAVRVSVLPSGERTTLHTILRWYRRLVAKKYDGSKTRRPSRPSTKLDIAALVVRGAGLELPDEEDNVPDHVNRTRTG